MKKKYQWNRIFPLAWWCLY